MVSSRHSLRWASWAVLYLASAGAAYAQLPEVGTQQPISLDAQSSEVDYKANTLIFRRVRISQGELAVEADEATATGLDFSDSRWQFRGQVRITVPDGFLRSDSAAIRFLKNAIAQAEASGAPASFEQKRGAGVARGRAQHIEYDFVEGTVRLTDDAWLSDGNNEISGRTLVYSMREQRVRANPEEQSNEGVHIVINPQKPPPKTPQGP
jgi:lipopolysaccharide transport protein LptA